MTCVRKEPSTKRGENVLTILPDHESTKTKKEYYGSCGFGLVNLAPKTISKEQLVYSPTFPKNLRKGFSGTMPRLRQILVKETNCVFFKNLNTSFSDPKDHFSGPTSGSRQGGIDILEPIQCRNLELNE